MAHSFNFTISSGEILSQCCISYKATNVAILPKSTLEQICLTIIKNAHIFWMAGDNKCLDENLNMYTLKTIMYEDKSVSNWLKQFKALKMHNDRAKYNPIWMNYMYLSLE